MRAAVVGLGLTVGAVLQPVAAQVRDTMRTDTASRIDSTSIKARARIDSLAKLRFDSLARRDSIRRADSVKAGIAVAELPIVADPTGSFHYTRKDMYTTGALTALDLVERVPGLTGLRANWIAEPQMGAYLGDLRRVRIFVDGFEMEELDPKMNRVFDLTQIPIWALDDLRIERSASEVRIHMRTWRVERTTPYSRTDIYTGDQNTNLYRGYLGRRYSHGEVLQLAGQQFSTNPGRTATGSDQLGVNMRFGIARKLWTADAVVYRTGRHRGTATTLLADDSVRSLESTRYDVYARFAWQDTARGWWAQGLAGTSSYSYAPPVPSGPAIPDTGRSRSQYVVTGGYSRGPWRASFTQRYLTGINRRIATPSARAGMETRRLTLWATAEGRGIDSTRRFDVSALVRPTSFLFVSGSFGGEQYKADSLDAPMFSRLEAGVRFREMWFSGGVIHRDAVELDPVRVLRPTTPVISEAAADGAFATIRGRVWGAIYLDLQGTRWSDTAGLYRPQYQTRSELYLSSSWLRKFPTGNFHIRAGLAHEYRSAMFWPDSVGTTRVPGYRTISTLLQFKIVSAEIFWVYRNAFDERYPQVPGYRLPRLSSVYGVRWEFWN